MEAAAQLRSTCQEARSIPQPVLVVDLDGTLLRTDLLLESVVALLKQAPHCVFFLPFWIWKGKANLKEQIARNVSLDVSVLPYRDDVLDYLRAEHAQGRSIALATASDMRIARQVADHLNLFDLIFASDGVTNLSGEAKRNRLVSEFGEKGFDCVGNDRHDLAVWASARKAIVVNPSRSVGSQVARVAQVDRIFADRRKRPVDYLKALRPHHWLKNLLVFVPLLAAHRVGEINLLEKALLAFVVLACFASGGYLMNDLLDLASDRSHPRKRYRPFASGELPLSYGLTMIPLLVGAGCLIGALISPIFVAMASTYFILSATYSLYARKIVLLDVILLAGLYTLRIMAGSAAVAIWPSPWLLAFSTFLFFSLALVKRYSELAANHMKARGYEPKDQELLAAMGVASGYVAILVLALYINTATAHILYSRSEVLWFLCPLLLYWISHVWLSAHRGKMPDDPVVFAASDRTSRILILLMLAVSMVAL
jgi:4-hydroxybenzoate polyprenyltransferase